MDFQATLFDTDRAEVPALIDVRRTPLSGGAWVDVLRNWLPDADDVFAALVAEVPWRAERRQMYDRVVDVPRLVHTYGVGEPLPHPVLEQARDRLSEHYLPELGEPFVTAGCCYYRDGWSFAHAPVPPPQRLLILEVVCLSASPATRSGTQLAQSECLQVADHDMWPVPQFTRGAPHDDATRAGQATLPGQVVLPVRDIHVESPVDLQHQDRAIRQHPLGIREPQPTISVPPTNLAQG